MCEWGVPALLTDRGAHTAVSSSSTSRALNRADSTWAHALSQGRGERRAAGAAVQNVTDTAAEPSPACTDRAVAGGVQHHWSSAQRQEAAERSLCPSYCTQQLTQEKWSAAIPWSRKSICCCHLQAMRSIVSLCSKSKQKLKGLVKNKESSKNFRPVRIHQS